MPASPRRLIAILIYVFHQLTSWGWWPWAKYTVLGILGLFFSSFLLRVLCTVFDIGGESRGWCSRRTTTPC